MLIVIPTYRRNDSVRWVLRSLIQCDTDKIPEKVRVLVVNNYPPAKNEIDKIVAEFSVNTHLDWNILCREKSLPPIENWYSAICDHAFNDEVVLLHGDDDILCPWSLEDRYAAICEKPADMLLSRSASRFIFLPDGVSGMLYPDAWPERLTPGETSEINLADIHHWGPAFIGNHCYRNTVLWRRALEVSFAWCHRQDWLDYDSRTLMLPVYLPYALKILQGRLSGLDRTNAIRGGSLTEIKDSTYGSPGWNSGFLALCAYGVFTSDPLAEITELDATRKELIMMATHWLSTMFFDPRIPAEIRRETFRRIRIPLTTESGIQLLLGTKLLLGEMLKLRGWRWNMLAKNSARPVSDLLQWPQISKP